MSDFFLYWYHRQNLFSLLDSNQRVSEWLWWWWLVGTKQKERNLFTTQDEPRVINKASVRNEKEKRRTCGQFIRRWGQFKIE